MSRFPTHNRRAGFPAEFAGKEIGFRIPYSMPGELIVLNGAIGQPFPDATFLLSRDKPFEIHRVLMRVTPFDNATPPAILPPPFIGAVRDLEDILRKYLRINLQDTSKNERITQNTNLMDLLVKKDEVTWEWPDPYTLVRAEGFQVTVDSQLANFTITVGATTLTVGNLRVELDFQGYLLVIAPPSETR